MLRAGIQVACRPANHQRTTRSNGGSAADAQHLAAEFVNRYDRDRAALAALALATDGSVRDARVLRGAPVLATSALGAVRLWRFTPTLLNGIPVDVMMTVTVNFAGQ